MSTKNKSVKLNKFVAPEFAPTISPEETVRDRAYGDAVDAFVDALQSAPRDIAEKVESLEVSSKPVVAYQVRIKAHLK